MNTLQTKIKCETKKLLNLLENLEVVFIEYLNMFSFVSFLVGVLDF